MPHKTTRIDGRFPCHSRKIEVLSFPNSLLIRKFWDLSTEKLYSSTIICYTQIEIKQPSADNPTQGLLSIFTSQPHLQTQLERLCRDNKFLNLNQLTILPKVAVWSIKIDLFIAQDQGGLLDLAITAIQTSLSNLQFPSRQLHLPHLPPHLQHISTRPLTLTPNYQLFPQTLLFLPISNLLTSSHVSLSSNLNTTTTTTNLNTNTTTTTTNLSSNTNTNLNTTNTNSTQHNSIQHNSTQHNSTHQNTLFIDPLKSELDRSDGLLELILTSEKNIAHLLFIGSVPKLTLFHTLLKSIDNQQSPR
ncbi:hypothetical protein NEHOM01_2341 [Nematocida homosporus]|uniref:uncharacterized protein n=1 Tax=Nematocida homosporus TaxID=1912981 RepID=UPI00221FEA06|nr:uncharacterized protein NEHOM01_2341 [Nematocida homosporus]KAI5187750.1 hypothetical protein NEHOM01_2341 [Nematocida homosporus]